MAAAKSAVNAALASIEAKIQDLMRAREILIDSMSSEPAADKPKRVYKRKKGLPANENLHLDPRSGI